MISQEIKEAHEAWLVSISSMFYVESIDCFFRWLPSRDGVTEV